MFLPFGAKHVGNPPRRTDPYALVLMK